MKDIKTMNLQFFAHKDGDVDNPEDVAKKTEPKQGQQGGKPEDGLNDKGDNKPEKKYSDEDVNRIIDERFKRWKTQQEKELDEAKKLAEMNAQEKLEYEKNKLQQELDELKRRDAINKMMGEARSMLKDYSMDDNLLAMLVHEDAEQTKANVESFAQLFEEAVEKTVNERIKSTAPKAGKPAMLTKEQIFAIKDTAERQKAIRENIELFR